MKYTLLPFSATITVIVSLLGLWWSNIQFGKPLEDYPDLIALIFGLTYIQFSVVLFLIVKESKHKILVFVLAILVLLVGIVALLMAAILDGIKHL